MMQLAAAWMAALRRGGVSVAPAQSIDAMQAIACLLREDARILGDKRRFLGALAGVIVRTQGEREAYWRVSEAFWSGQRPPANLWERLRARGVVDGELALIRALLGDVALSTSADRLSDLDALLWQAGLRNLEALGLARPGAAGEWPKPGEWPNDQMGLLLARAEEDVGISRHREALGALRRAISESLGEDRAERIVAWLGQELESAVSAWRTAMLTLAESGETASKAGAADDGFYDDGAFQDRESVRGSLVALAQRMSGARRSRRRAKGRDRLHLRRTMRASLSTGGVPLRWMGSSRQRQEPELVVVCDVSQSVREVAELFLSIVLAASDCFTNLRVFAFVDRLVEVDVRKISHTDFSRRLHELSGLNAGAVSHYARALGDLEARLDEAGTARRTLLVLGDGRDSSGTLARQPEHGGPAVMGRIRNRFQRVLWLCPEGPALWGRGDSQMLRYREHLDALLIVRNAAELAVAVRAL